VVHVPIDHGTAGPVRPTAGSEPAVDDTQLVLVVADAELDICGRPLGRAHEVRLDAEQLGVPVPGGGDVLGEEADGGKPSQHWRFLISSLTATILRLKVLIN